MAEGRVIQVRDVDPEVVAKLARVADSRGLTLSAYLRQRLAEVAMIDEAKLDWATGRPDPVPGLTREFIVDTIRETRGPLGDDA